jgi:hypothetical protein
MAHSRNKYKSGDLSEPETVGSFFTGDVNVAMQNAQIFITTYVGSRNNRAASDKARKVDQRYQNTTKPTWHCSF